MDLRLLLLSVCLVACFGHGESQGFGGIFRGIRRSVVGFISSGINDLKGVGNWFFSGKSDIKTHEHSKEKSISTEDLFQGLNDVWSVKKQRPIRTNTSGPDNDDKSEELIYEPKNFNAIVVKDLVDKIDFEPVGDNGSEIEASSWLRIKAIIENMKSIFKRTYGEDSNEKSEILDMIDKMINIGDKINLVKNIEDSFDKDLLTYLYEKWRNIQENVLKSNPTLKIILSVDGKVLLLTIARGLVRQFSRLFHQQALVHVSEQDFVINTMRESGFHDTEIYDVFKLLDLPTHFLTNSSKTLNKDKGEETVDGRGLFKFGGMLGGGGGYGDTGGYNSMMKKDPLILLAGLAFATFAAYLIYRLLSSTPPVEGRNKKGLDGSSLSLYMSDIPVMMTNLHSWVERGQRQYENSEELPETAIDNFIKSINNLWRSYKAEDISKSCVTRYLCEEAVENPLKTIQYGVNFNQLITLTLAEIFGAKNSAKNSDIYIQKLTNDQTVNCQTEAPMCDNRIFNSIFNKFKRKTM